MKEKAKKTLATLVTMLALALPTQLKTQSNPKTLDKLVAKYVNIGNIKPEYLVSQYILREPPLPSSYVRRYELDGKMFEEFYMIIPMQFKHPLGISVPITDKPYYYYFDNKWYKDEKIDGLNGNEIDEKLENEKNERKEKASIK